MEKEGVFESFRKALVEVLVPELREIRTEMRVLSNRMSGVESKLDLVLQRLDFAERISKLEGEMAVLLKKRSA
ncbi:MAG: hypothetical protein AAB215_08240 [Planctomycetota bacterium]